MVRLLLPLLVAASLSPLPPAQAFPNWLGWLWGSGTSDRTTMAPAIEPREVGPGCAEGYPYYPGVPEYVNSQCPIPDDPEPLVIENAHDCSSYFLCNEGTATLECCPAGLLYDTPMQTCDDPPHVECNTRPILPVPTTTTESTTTTTESTTTTTTESTSTITESTTTESTSTTTESPSTTTESSSTSSTTTVPPPPPIDSKCDDLPGYTGKLPMEGDCTKYYMCNGVGGSEGIIMSCPVGVYGQQVYNPTIQDCDDQWHYPCEDHMIHT